MSGVITPLILVHAPPPPPHTQSAVVHVPHGTVIDCAPGTFGGGGTLTFSDPRDGDDCAPGQCCACAWASDVRVRGGFFRGSERSQPGGSDDGLPLCIHSSEECVFITAVPWRVRLQPQYRKPSIPPTHFSPAAAVN
jgi:hypothetical protein